MQKSRDLLLDYISRCQLLGIEPVVDDIWCIKEQGGEVCLDNMRLGIYDKDSNILRLKDDLCAWETLKVPAGITKMSSGCFPKDLWVAGLRLNLNQIDRLMPSCFRACVQILQLVAPCVKHVDVTSLLYMQNLQLLALPSVYLNELTPNHFAGIQSGCKLVIPGYTGTIQGFKQIQLRQTHMKNYRIF